MGKSLLQSDFWAELKKQNGWNPEKITDVNVLIRSLPLNLKMAYAPEVNGRNWQEWLPQFIEEIRVLAKREKLVFARLEIWEPENEELIKLLRQFRFKKSFEEVQPEWRQVVNISPSEEEILAQMKQKGRYNIRIAEKHGVETEVHNNPEKAAEDAKTFHDLMSVTGARNRFSIRPISYFQNLLEMLYNNQAGDTIIAKWQGKPLAALIISYYDGTASYLYGASSNENREVMAPYMAHWAAIQEAKKRNCREYDLLAVAPEGSINHKYSSLSRFKEQFGGETRHLVGSWDLIFRPFWYTMYRLGEKYRRHI